jgi:hypothetical protein
MVDERPRGLEDGVVWLRPAEPTHFDAAALAVACLHVASDWDEFFD